MKKLKTAIIILLMLTIFVGLFGCSKKVSHTPVNIEDFQEIDVKELSSCLQILSIESVWQVGGGIDKLNFISEDMRIAYDYYNLMPDFDDDNYSPYINEDGILINPASISHARGRFLEIWNKFEDYYEDNPDDIIMEMQDTRGYIVFDIDDPELITALTGKEDVNEDTIYYGCVYFCDRGCLEAYILSDNYENFDKFVEFLDALNLPHL